MKTRPPIVRWFGFGGIIYDKYHIYMYMCICVVSVPWNLGFITHWMIIFEFQIIVNVDHPFEAICSHELLVTEDGPASNSTLINMQSCPIRKPIPVQDRKNDMIPRSIVAPFIDAFPSSPPLELDRRVVVTHPANRWTAWIRIVLEKWNLEKAVSKTDPHQNKRNSPWDLFKNKPSKRYLGISG